MNRQLEVTFKSGEVYVYPADERGWAPAVRGGRRYLLVGYAMIPEDVVERWRLVEPTPVPDGRCPSVMDRKGAPGADIRCALAPGHAVCHRGYDRLGNELQWLDAPDPAEVEEVVQWAERQAGADRCPMAANQRGVHIPCDLETDHAGRAHANREHGIIWSA